MPVRWCAHVRVPVCRIVSCKQALLNKAHTQMEETNGRDEERRSCGMFYYHWQYECTLRADGGIIVSKLASANDSWNHNWIPIIFAFVAWIILFSCSLQIYQDTRLRRWGQGHHFMFSLWNPKALLLCQKWVSTFLEIQQKQRTLVLKSHSLPFQALFKSEYIV